MKLRILDPGLYTLLVDFGRPRTRSLGVPVGGAADRWSLAIGNALMGNPPGAPALEVTLSGPTLKADCDLACVVYGARFTLNSGGRTLPAGKTFTLNAEEELRIEGAQTGARAYLCVRGGLDAPLVLGSRSSLEPLRAETELLCQAGTIGGRFIREDFTWNREPRTLRVVRGLQADWFPEGDFYHQQFTVSSSSNRMGLRLIGQLAVPERELVSEPVCPGSVQVTRDGQCIVLGSDGQTIGGYPKIAQVITADLDKLAQLRTGEQIEFRSISLAEAERVYRQKENELHEWLTRLTETFPVNSS
jgi:antagonist of KipI